MRLRSLSVTQRICNPRAEQLPISDAIPSLPQDPQGARRHSEGGHHSGCPPCQEKILLWLKGTPWPHPPGLAHRAHLNPARGSHHSQSRPLSLTGICLPQRKGSTSTQESCSWSTLVFPLPSFSRFQMPIPFLPFPHLQLGFLGKETDGFSQRSHHMPSPPPFFPHPLPLRASECHCHGNCRVDLLLPAGHRYSTWAMNARVACLALAPVLWMPMGHSWHMLHGPQGACAVLRGANLGTRILFPTPHPPPPGVLLLPRLQGPASLSSHWPMAFAPGVLKNSALQRTPSLFSSPPTHSWDSQVDWGL